VFYHAALLPFSSLKRYNLRGFPQGGGESVMKDFLYECSHEMSTGNAGVDQINTIRLSLQPEYWALIDYLAEKGILDEKEFAVYLGRHFKAQVATAERLSQEEAEE
jgi:hypothetical protein